MTTNRTIITHIWMEENQYADFLAYEGHKHEEDMLNWKEPLKKMEFFFLVDSKHVAFERF